MFLFVNTFIVEVIMAFEAYEEYLETEARLRPILNDVDIQLTLANLSRHYDILHFSQVPDEQSRQWSIDLSGVEIHMMENLHLPADVMIDLAKYALHGLTIHKDDIKRL